MEKIIIAKNYELQEKERLRKERNRVQEKTGLVVLGDHEIQSLANEGIIRNQKEYSSIEMKANCSDYQWILTTYYGGKPEKYKKAKETEIRKKENKISSMRNNGAKQKEIENWVKKIESHKRHGFPILVAIKRWGYDASDTCN